ncbi:hypothetical protein HDU76_001569 [Blyttiomyces sp. JEL0837]|nr:hypothetical protein HDU76_001569 [Blyttiomyces sp. JEL0837]
MAARAQDHKGPYVEVPARPPDNTYRPAIHISHLPLTIAPETLFRFFIRYGQVQGVLVNPSKRKHTSYAYVVFTTDEQVKSVIKSCHGTSMFGHLHHHVTKAKVLPDFHIFDRYPVPKVNWISGVGDLSTCTSTFKNGSGVGVSPVVNMGVPTSLDYSYETNGEGVQVFRPFNDNGGQGCAINATSTASNNMTMGNMITANTSTININTRTGIPTNNSNITSNMMQSRAGPSTSSMVMSPVNPSPIVNVGNFGTGFTYNNNGGGGQGPSLASASTSGPTYVHNAISSKAVSSAVSTATGPGADGQTANLDHGGSINIEASDDFEALVRAAQLHALQLINSTATDDVSSMSVANSNSPSSLSVDASSIPTPIVTDGNVGEAGKAVDSGTTSGMDSADRPVIPPFNNYIPAGMPQQELINVSGFINQGSGGITGFDPTMIGVGTSSWGNNNIGSGDDSMLNDVLVNASILRGLGLDGDDDGLTLSQDQLELLQNFF